MGNTDIEKEESTVESGVEALSDALKDSEDKALDKKLKKEQKKAEKKAKKEAKKKGESEDTSSENEEKKEEEIDSEDVSYDADGNVIIKKKRKKSKKKQKPEEHVNIVKELLSLIIYIGVVVLLCFVIINYVGCRSKVDGSSMNPTLENGDNLWVDKLSYEFGNPKRFDVVIFNYDDETTYVKRIIGLPGEKVRIDESGNIYINGELLKEDYGKEPILPTLLGRASSDVELGEDEYFVLGDNRNNSSDSRWADVGNVSKEDIVGKVLFRFYPVKDFGIIK